MSEAAAAFFANKKRKKKAFKFNANLIDSSSMTHTIHVDAPALSKDVEAPQPNPLTAAAPVQAFASPVPVVTDNELEASNMDAVGPTEDEHWIEAVAVARSKTIAAASPEVLDMKSLAQTKGTDNITEKLRLEETKAQLAAAREGMEREASRAKAEKERKDQDAKDKEAAKTGAGIWVSSRMRAAQSTLPKVRMGAAGQIQLDTSNEELFPDLASADKILEQKEKSSSALRGPKKTPVGGGASWATKPPVKTKTPAKPPMKRPVDLKDDKKTTEPESLNEEEISPSIPEPEPVTPAGPEPTPEPEATPEPDLADDTAAEAEVVNPATTAASALKPKKTPGKKKKKDLSSFKPGAT